MKDPILITEKIPFTQVANEILNDENLSLKAKGIYAYLYSKPDNYEFSSKRIKNDHSDGYSSILSALRELESANYLIREKQRDGRIIYKILLKACHPISDKAKVQKLHPAETRPISNIDNTNNTELNTNNIDRCAFLETGSSSPYPSSPSPKVNSEKFCVEFEKFWEIYPRHIDKKTAKKSFIKILNGNINLFQIILKAIQQQINFKKKEKDIKGWTADWKHPASWLNKESWNDECDYESLKNYKYQQQSSYTRPIDYPDLTKLPPIEQ